MDEVIHELRRIADAFEAQNTINQEWTALQKKWHEEAQTLNEQRHQEGMDLQRQVLVFQRECHSEAERLNELRYQEHSARENKLTMAYIDSLTRKETSDEPSQ